MEEKKKSKKWIAIVIVLIVLLVIGGIVGYLLYQKMQEEETVETDWGDTYYEYLEKAQKSENKKKFGFEDGAKEQKIRFLESDDSENPNMIMNYEKDGEDRVSIYFVVEDKIEYYNPETESEVKLLYNIENKDYDWYLLAEKDEKEEVTSINEIKNGNTEAEYTFNSEEEREEQFIEVKTEDDGIELDELDDEDLEDAIKDAVKEFKTDDKIITKEVKTKVENKVLEIEENKKDNETKKVSSDFIQAGEYTLKYGKYVGVNYLETANPDSRYDIVIELKTDGLYEEIDTFSDGKEETYGGRYSIVDGSKYGMTGKMLELNNDRGIFSVIGNNEFCFVAGTGGVFEYQEEKTSNSGSRQLVVETLSGTSNVKETDEGIQFEDKLLKFGKYENKLIGDQILNNSAYSILTLKPNGEFHLKANVDIDSGDMITPVDEDGTFYIEENVEDFPGTYSDYLIFETESGIEFTLYSAMSNQWTGYEYIGE